VNADHVDLAHEILFDMFQNLISWLEDSVEVGGNKQKEAKIHDGLLVAYGECTPHDLDNFGDGWRLQSIMQSVYMEKSKVSKSTAERHFKDFGSDLFNRKKSNGRVYLRKKGENQ